MPLNFISNTYSGTGQQTEIILDPGEPYLFVVRAGLNDIYDLEFKFTIGSQRIIHPHYNNLNFNSLGSVNGIYSLGLNILSNVSGSIGFEISKNFTR